MKEIRQSLMGRGRKGERNQAISDGEGEEGGKKSGNH